MAKKIDVKSGDPYRDLNGHFGTSPEEKLKAALDAVAGKKFVSHDDNKKKVASVKKDAAAKLAELRDGGKTQTDSNNRFKTLYHGSMSDITGDFKLSSGSGDRISDEPFLSLTDSKEIAGHYATSQGKVHTITTSKDFKVLDATALKIDHNTGQDQVPDVSYENLSLSKEDLALVEDYFAYGEGKPITDAGYDAIAFPYAALTTENIDGNEIRILSDKGVKKLQLNADKSKKSDPKGKNVKDEPSKILADKPAKPKMGTMTPAEKDKVNEALKYLREGQVGEVTLNVSKLGNRYGNASGKRVYIDSATLDSEHPLFIAGIIHHESIHTRQAMGMKPQMKETQARVMTRFWASTKLKDANAQEKIALNKIIKEQS